METARAPLPWARHCYGIELDGDRLTAVRAERAGRRVRFRPVEPGGPRLAADLERGVPAAVCLGPRRGLTRWISAPFPRPAKARRVLPTLLDVDLPFALEECVYRFLSVQPAADGTCDALAVAARRGDVEAHLAELRALGVDPAVLDHQGPALWTQSLHEAAAPPADPPRLRAVLHMGRAAWCLCLGRGTRFLNAHAVRPFDRRQVERLLRTYAAGGPEPLAWFTSGADAAEDARSAAFWEGLDAGWVGSRQAPGDPALFLARAAARRALTSGPLRCNLRTGELAHPRVATQDRVRSLKAAALCLAAGVALCVLNLGLRAAAEARERRCERAALELAEQLSHGRLQGARGSDALLVARRAAEDDRVLLQPFLAAVRPGPGAALRLLLRSASELGLSYEVLTLADGRLSLGGLAPDWNTCEELAGRLEQSGLRVRLDRREARLDERIPFTLQSRETDHD